MKQTVNGIVAAGLTMCALMCACKKDKPESNGDGPVAQHIDCVNNLKEIGSAFKLWEGNHNGRFPFQVSTNAGGTMELCMPDMVGFDGNSYLHFKVLSGDDGLKTPLLLVCPQDTSKQAITNWQSLTAKNVTYRLRADTNASDADQHQILAVCPVDGNILYCDGTVKESTQYLKNNPAATNSMHVQ
jgi:hypothetical protein